MASFKIQCMNEKIPIDAPVKYSILPGDGKDGARCPSHLVGKFFFLKYGKLSSNEIGTFSDVELVIFHKTFKSSVSWKSSSGSTKGKNERATEAFKDFLNQEDKLFYSGFEEAFFDDAGWSVFLAADGHSIPEEGYEEEFRCEDNGFVLTFEDYDFAQGPYYPYLWQLVPSVIHQGGKGMVLVEEFPDLPDLVPDVGIEDLNEFPPLC